MTESTKATGMSDETRSAASEVQLDVAPERVWQALTEAGELERWFPLEARVEPGEGGSLWMSWKNEYTGASEILAWDPPRHLRTTWGWSEGEAARVTDYRIEARDGGTCLRVVTSGFPMDATWDEWLEGTRLGWRFELESLRLYLEEHRGADRDVLHLRRRAKLSRQQAWDALMGPDGLDVEALASEPFAVHSPRHWAAITSDPDKALLRVSMEPCMAGPDLLDVTVWFQAWGEGRDRLGEFEARWRPMIEQRIPDGDWA